MKVLCILLLFPVLLASSQGPSDGCSLNTTVVAGDFSSSSLNGESSYQYTTSIVDTGKLCLLFTSILYHFSIFQTKTTFVSYLDGIKFMHTHPHVHTHTQTEYIVTFNGYYSTEAREGYVSAALQPYKEWSIVPRSNPSQDFPSDFSLVRLKSTVSDALSALREHPNVKRVTPQKKLTRMLTFAGDGQYRIYV